MDSLMAMGFGEDDATRALVAAEGNPERAVEFLLSGHIPEPPGPTSVPQTPEGKGAHWLSLLKAGLRLLDVESPKQQFDAFEFEAEGDGVATGGTCCSFIARLSHDSAPLLIAPTQAAALQQALPQRGGGADERGRGEGEGAGAGEGEGEGEGGSDAVTAAVAAATAGAVAAAASDATVLEHLLLPGEVFEATEMVRLSQAHGVLGDCSSGGGSGAAGAANSSSSSSSSSGGDGGGDGGGSGSTTPLRAICLADGRGWIVCQPPVMRPSAAAQAAAAGVSTGGDGSAARRLHRLERLPSDESFCCLVHLPTQPKPQTPKTVPPKVLADAASSSSSSSSSSAAAVLTASGRGTPVRPRAANAKANAKSTWQRAKRRLRGRNAYDKLSVVGDDDDDVDDEGDNDFNRSRHDDLGDSNGDDGSGVEISDANDDDDANDGDDDALPRTRAERLKWLARRTADTDAALGWQGVFLIQYVVRLRVCMTIFIFSAWRAHNILRLIIMRCLHYLSSSLPLDALLDQSQRTLTTLLTGIYADRRPAAAKVRRHGQVCIRLFSMCSLASLLFA
jgi:hypothetical protein